MKEYKIDQLSNSIKGSKNKSSRPKIKGFGYQVLGFGSGGEKAIYTLNYLVVGGGGGSGAANSSGGAGQKLGGGGAGGYRTSGFGPAPLQGSAISCVEGGTYAVVVGAGGPTSTSNPVGCGNASSFNAPSPVGITSAGGGHGASHKTQMQAGGSGGGCAPGSAGGGAAGNTPPTCPPQGNDGGDGGGEDPNPGGGGGGGATAAGGDQPGGCQRGGAGAPNAISGSAVTYATGGTASPVPEGGDGAANTGEGGGSKSPGSAPCGLGGNGGPGIVIVRLPSDATLAVNPGTNTTGVAPDCSSYKIATFTVSGCLTIS